jgi:hypothetical protein
VTMIIKIGLCEPSIGSIMVIITTIRNVPRLIFMLNGMQQCFFFGTLFVFSHVSTSYKNESMSHISKTFGRFFFSLSWWKQKRIYYMLHIASYHYNCLAKFYLSNMTSR